MLKKIIFIGLSAVLFHAGIKAQEKIALTVDGSASENAKTTAKTTIVSTVNQSNAFRIANTSEDITLIATVNKGEGNFEILFKVTHKSKNFEKLYSTATESGYAGFEEIIKSKVNQILAELPRTNPITTKQQQPKMEQSHPVDDNLEVTHRIRNDRYTQPDYEEETTLRRGFELGLETGLGYSVELGDLPFVANIIADYRFSPQMAVGLGMGISQYAFFDFNFSDAKISPFVRFELGLTPYTYEYYYYYYDYSSYYESYSENSFYVGATGGIRYSFNRCWALQAGAKLYHAFEEDLVVGLNVGVVFHF